MDDYRKIAGMASIFNGLSKEEQECLLEDGRINFLNKKEFLFHHGDPLQNFYVICLGTIQIYRNNIDGQRKTFDILTTQDIICDNKIFDSNSNYQYNAVAISDATVLEFSKTWLKENAKKYGEFALNLLAITSNNTQMAEVEVEHKATMSAAQIIACFLQRICKIYNFNPQSFELPYNKKLIASRLGIEFETFSRSLPKLKDYGISVEGNLVQINSLNSLEENVCNHCSVQEDCPLHNSLREKIQISLGELSPFSQQFKL